MTSGAGTFVRALSRDPVLAAVALGRSLQAAGLPVTPDRSASFVAAAFLLGPTSRDQVYWAARLGFVTSRDQIPVFDAVFASIVDGIADPAGDSRGEPNATTADRRAARAPAPGVAPTLGGAAGGADAGRGRGRPDTRHLPIGLHASAAERLADVRLEELDDSELALVGRLLRGLAFGTPPRRARRSRRSSRGEHLDVRATLRRSHRTGGDPVKRLNRRRRERPRRLVALLDVSGSMAPHARVYMLLLDGAARGARAETFVFATRLTRITKALREGRARAALERAAAAAPDWAGGTRLGEAMRTFNDRFGRRGMARDAVVVVFSDGWERGDPSLLGREMERLGRLAYRIVWVNPRVAARGFSPVTGGMAAALPYIDELVSGHSLAALDAVIEAIGRHR